MATVNERGWRPEPGLITSLLRYWWIVVSLAVVFAVAGYVIADLQPPTYEAGTTLILKDPQESTLFSNQRSVDPDRYVPQQAELVQSRSVLEIASEAYLDGAIDTKTIRDDLTVSSDVELNRITIRYADSDAERAASVANAVSEAYQQWTKDRIAQNAQAAVAELQDIVESLQEQADNLPEPDLLNQRIADTQAQMQQLTADAALFGTGVAVYEDASVPEAPSAPLPKRAGALAGFLGGVLGALIAYALGGRARQVRSRKDAEQILGVPVLGEVPLLEGVDDPLSLGEEPSHESYQFVLASIEFALLDIGGRSVLMTSPRPGEGKTLTTLHIAAAAARDEKSVVAIDGDVRAHGLTRLLDGEQLPGLAEVLVNQSSVDEAVYHFWLDGDVRIPVLTAGRRRSDAGRALRTDRITELLEELGQKNELILIDSAPLLAVSDTAALAGRVDGIVLIIKHQTPFEDLWRIKERLAFTSTPVLGFVYMSPDSASKHYGYGYDAGSDREAGPLRRLRRAGADRLHIPSR